MADATDGYYHDGAGTWLHAERTLHRFKPATGDAPSIWRGDGQLLTPRGPVPFQFTIHATTPEAAFAEFDTAAQAEVAKVTEGVRAAQQSRILTPHPQSTGIRNLGVTK